MNATNKLVFSKANYETVDALFEAVGKAIADLIRNNQMVVSYKYKEALSTVVIEYLPAFDEGPKPYWLWQDEADYVREYVEEAAYQLSLQGIADYEAEHKIEEPVEAPDAVFKKSPKKGNA